jgi:hypothetical protein
MPTIAPDIIVEASLVRGIVPIVQSRQVIATIVLPVFIMYLRTTTNMVFMSQMRDIVESGVQPEFEVKG